ncbi:MAG: ATP-binding protein [Eubacteriales bacterium]|nr:ATP-binding protein [Eubacteriales bacterium]MDD4326705.1 ATP-binding protein [Eubacteriales bacterium]MDD4716752.1 ATP-binding protein [Eubacteriales bacterium]
MNLTESFRKIISLFEEQSAWIVLFLGVAAGVLVGMVAAVIYFRRERKSKSKLLDATVSRFLHEKNKAEAILSDLDVGIVAYGGDGSLINYNNAFCKILQIEEPPGTFKRFLFEFGRENGLQAGIMLGTGLNEVHCEIGSRNVRIKLKNAMLERDSRSATLISVQDITTHEQENKRRKEFVANVSHELRTPLTTIKTYTESLLDWGLKEKSPESVRKDILRVHEDSIRMETLVDNLLLLSRIDNKGMVSGMDQHDLEAITRSVIERLQLQAQEKKIKLQCYSLGKLPWIFADRSGIERILLNIVSNAIKYTENSGKVTVYLGILVDDVYVKVSDTGFGIAEDKIPFIFDRFYRVDMTGSRMYGGTGLGLSIAKELTDYHRGDISVNSILGKGTDFIIRIPTARKLFADAFEYVPTGSGETEINIYAEARKLLSSRAKEIGMHEGDLGKFQAEDITELIERTVYDNIDDSLE